MNWQLFEMMVLSLWIKEKSGLLAYLHVLMHQVYSETGLFNFG